MKEEKWIRCARAASKKSDHPRIKMGAVVIKCGKVIASGCNSDVRTSPVQKMLDEKYFGEPCCGKIHAEIDALNRCEGGDCVVVYREFKRGGMALARPCPRCMQIIKARGIKKIVYSTPDGIAVEKIRIK